jgi:hypothetical protein
LECNGCFKVFDTPLDSHHCDVCMCEIFSTAGRARGRQLTFHSGALDVDTAVRHTESLIKHITYVREAGEKLGVDKAQLACHDDSKWSDEEFLDYAINFQGDKSPVLKATPKKILPAPGSITSTTTPIIGSIGFSPTATPLKTPESKTV